MPNGPAAAPADAGLVLYTEPARNPQEFTGFDIGALWQPRFATGELIGAAAELLPAISELPGAIAEGPRWQIVISPGVLRVRTRDYARAERGHERRLRRHQADSDTRIRAKGEDMHANEPVRGRGRIRGWSARSRAHLVARLSDLDYTRLYGRYKSCTGCGLDYSVELDRCPGCRCTDGALTDRTGRLPCMLTLTYPGDWVTVAPDGETVKRHLSALGSRYKRAWGEPLIGVWKLEFQRRGAPHFHLSTTPPMGMARVRDPHTGEPIRVDFRRWLSIVWADIVAHPDPEQWRRHLAAGTGVDYAEGIRCIDPRRMAVYFAKYGHGGAKDYQHQVPPQWLSARLRCADCDTAYFENGDDPCPACGSYEAELIEEAGGAGRIWGYWGLRPVLAAREVTPAVGIQIGRVMRRWYRAKRLTRKITVQRVDQVTGRVYTRRSTVRKKLFVHNRGFAVVNDGPAFAAQLARYLNSLEGAGLPCGAATVVAGRMDDASIRATATGTTGTLAASSRRPHGASHRQKSAS
jgi:hypothetical protein